MAFWRVCRDSDLRTLTNICRESDLRTFAAYMSRKWFMHSVRKVFAREILPNGKFWLFVSLMLRFTIIFVSIVISLTLFVFPFGFVKFFDFLWMTPFDSRSGPELEYQYYLVSTGMWYILLTFVINWRNTNIWSNQFDLMRQPSNLNETILSPTVCIS